MAAKPEAKEKAPKAAKETTAKKPAAKETTKKTEGVEAAGTVKSERGKTAEKKHHHKSQVPRSERHCEVKGCKREYRAKGYCVSHYKKWRQGEYGHRRYSACSTTSCNKPMGKNRHGFCEDHYQSYYVKGVAVAKEPVAEKPAKPEAKAEAKTAAA